MLPENPNCPARHSVQKEAPATKIFRFTENGQVTKGPSMDNSCPAAANFS
jgi:hypothetical protein